jgi:large subunit ribosomal protein L5
MAKEDKKQDKKQDKSADKPERKPAPQQQAKPKKEAQAPKKEAAPKSDVPEMPAPPARLATFYKDKVVPDLMQKFGYKTVMQVPRIRKITVNMGVGETTSDKKVLDHAVADMTKIAGQKPVVTLARRSIANFKVRAGFPVGCMVTLRGARMYEFLDRLVNVALPRVRDFKGVPPKGFDGRGNYAMGLREQLIFPEIVYDKIDKVRGMDINIVTTARTDEDAKALLQHLGMPFRES